MRFKNKALAEVYSKYSGSAKLRKHIFDLQPGEFEELTSKECIYCSSPPSRTTQKWNGTTNTIDTYKWNGIDRVDSNEGYHMDNCVPCCTTCNRMKMDLDVHKFFNQIRRIYNKHIRLPDDDWKEKQWEDQLNE